MGLLFLAKQGLWDTFPCRSVSVNSNDSIGSSVPNNKDLKISLFKSHLCINTVEGVGTLKFSVVTSYQSADSSCRLIQMNVR